MLVARLTLMIYGALYSSLTYLVARRTTSRWTSLAAAYLLLISALPTRFIFIHNWDSSLWALGATYAAVLFLQTGRPRAAFATGTLTAWTFLFEQSKGACLGFALVAAFAWIAWSSNRSAFRRFSAWAAMGIGATWPFLLVTGYWAHVGALRQMWNDWLWPLHHYASANAVSYGAIFKSYEDWNDVFANSSWLGRGIAALILSPCIVIDLLINSAVVRAYKHAIIKRERETSTLAYYVLVSAAASSMGLCAVLSRRADTAHLIFAGPPLFLVLPWLIQVPTVLRWLPGAGSRWLAGFFLGSFSLYGAVPITARARMSVPTFTRRGALEVGQQNGGLEYLMSHTYPGERVLVYPYSPLLYYLTDTYSPATFDFLQPGMHTREQFDEAVRAVEADRTPLVLYETSFFSDSLYRFWPSTSPEAIAREPMRELLLSEYRPCAIIKGDDRFVAFWRKDIPCPPKPAP